MNFLRLNRRGKEFGIKESKKDEEMENWAGKLINRRLRDRGLGD
jgi:hypothetical protein